MPGWNVARLISPSIANVPDPPMLLTGLALHAYQLPLRRAWRSAAGGMVVRNGWLLRLKSADGRYGFGDCAPLPAIGTESPAAALATLQGWQARLPGMSIVDALEHLSAAPLGIPAPAARCAMETALLDLQSQEAGLPLAAHLGARHSKTPVNAALGALEDLQPAALAQALDQGYRILKLKLGLASTEKELELLRQLASTLPPGVALRLDANRAWSAAEAHQLIDSLAGLPVESLEEPLQTPTWREWQSLQARCAFPLAVDESLAFFPEASWHEADVRRLILKPPALGGLLATRELARSFIGAGGECVVTSTLESSGGILAATHLALALDGLRPPSTSNSQAGTPPHGLATASWLEADLCPPAMPNAGFMSCPEIPGLGFTPRSDLPFPEDGPH